jgi:hypothetical protein
MKKLPIVFTALTLTALTCTALLVGLALFATPLLAADDVTPGAQHSISDIGSTVGHPSNAPSDSAPAPSEHLDKVARSAMIKEKIAALRRDIDEKRSQEAVHGHVDGPAGYEAKIAADQKKIKALKAELELLSREDL